MEIFYQSVSRDEVEKFQKYVTGRINGEQGTEKNVARERQNGEANWGIQSSRPSPSLSPVRNDRYVPRERLNSDANSGIQSSSPFLATTRNSESVIREPVNSEANSGIQLSPSFTTDDDENVIREPVNREANWRIKPSQVSPQLATARNIASPSQPDSSFEESDSLPRLFSQDMDTEMKCTQVNSPAEFYLQIRANHTYDTLKREMQQFYTCSKNKPNKIELGKAYAIVYNEKWTRVMLIDTCDSDDFFTCFLLDEGITGFADAEEIFELDDKFKHVAPQAVKASLFGIKPLGSDAEWTAESVKYFTNWAEDKWLQVIVIEYNQEKRCLICNLMLDDDNILEELVSKGFGELSD